MSRVLQTPGYSFRQLRRSPGFTVALRDMRPEPKEWDLSAVEPEIKTRWRNAAQQRGLRPGMALTIEHFITLKREKLAPTALAEELQALIDEEKYDDAIELCDSEGGYLASIISSALRMRHAGHEPGVSGAVAQCLGGAAAVLVRVRQVMVGGKVIRRQAERLACFSRLPEMKMPRVDSVGNDVDLVPVASQSEERLRSGGGVIGYRHVRGDMNEMDTLPPGVTHTDLRDPTYNADWQESVPANASNTWADHFPVSISDPDPDYIQDDTLTCRQEKASCIDICCAAHADSFAFLASQGYLKGVPLPKCFPEMMPEV